MEWVLAVLAVLVLTGALTTALAVQLARALRRRARVLADRAGLRARSWGSGAPGELARARRELAESVEGLRRALAVSRETAAPIGDVPALLRRLERAAEVVDGELRVIEALRDPVRIAALLPGPQSRARALAESAERLGRGLVEAGAGAATDVAVLQADCALEAEALREVSRSARSPRPA
ncbi:MAG TPA: hypothetical protein VLC50_05620 [Actinomycetes bacterium]|nr:hypothetical protein [Actinomycetes bacterium]